MHRINDHTSQHPFEFYLMEPVAYFQCHTKAEEHLKGSILIFSRLDRRIDLIRTKYQEQLRSDIVNPFPLAEERLVKLIQINTDQTNGDRSSRSLVKLEPNDEVDAKALPSKLPNSLYHLICSYCNLKLRRDQYLMHLKKHCKQLCCFECGDRVGSLAEIFAHDKKRHGIDRINYQCTQLAAQLSHTFLNMKIIFENGLVLHNLNLVGTKFDGSAIHDAFVQSLIELEKIRYSKSMARAQPDIGMERMDNMDMELTAEDFNQSESIDSDSLVENPDPNLLTVELKRQNDIMKNLTVRGIPRICNLDLMKIFIAFCSSINADIRPDDIRSIDRLDTTTSDTIIVKFHHLQKKMLVRKLAIDKEIWLHALIKLPPGTKSARVLVNSQVTLFYAEIQKMAKIARHMGSLYSYQFRKEGFFVKRTAESNAQLVLSKEQLRNYINGAEN